MIALLLFQSAPAAAWGNEGHVAINRVAAQKIPAAMPTQMSSTAQDLARGKPSEIDFLNGYVVRKGAELGIPTPTNHALQVMAKLAERSNEVPRGRT